MAWGSGRGGGDGRSVDLVGWRWQGYLEHLEDLGYDIWGGTQPEDEPAQPERGLPAHAAGSRRGETETH